MQNLLMRFRARDRAVSSSGGSRSTTSTDMNEIQMPTTPSTPRPLPPLPVGYMGSNMNMSDTPTTPTRITTQYERKIHPHVDALLEEYASAPSSPTSVNSPLSPGRHGHTAHHFGDILGGLAPAPPATPHAHKETGSPPTVSRVPFDSSPVTPIPSRPPRAHTRAPSSGSPLPVSPEYEQPDFEPTRDPAFFDAFERVHYGRSYSGSSSPTMDSQGRFRLSRVSLPGVADVWSTFGRRSVEGKGRERPMSIASVASVSAVGGGYGGQGGGPSAWFTRKGGKGKKKRKIREGSVRSAASSADGSGSGHGSASGHGGSVSGHAGNISKESSGNASTDRNGNTSGSKDGGESTRSSKGKDNRVLPSPPGSAFHVHVPGNRPGSVFGMPITPAAGGQVSPALSAFNAPSVSTLASPIPSLYQAARSPASSLASPHSSFASPHSSFAINIAVQPPTRNGSPARAVPMGYGYTYPQERERRMSIDEFATPRRGARKSDGVEVQGNVGITSPSPSPGTQRKHAPLRAYRSVPRANAIFPSSSPVAPYASIGPRAEGEERRPSAALFAAQALQEEDEDNFGRVEWPARVSGEIIRLSLTSPSRRQSALSSAAYSRQSALSSASGTTTTELGERVQGVENIAGRKSIDTVGTFGPCVPSRVKRTPSDASAAVTRPSPNSNAANNPLSLPASTSSSSASSKSPYRAFDTFDASTAPTSQIYTYSEASAASDTQSPWPSTYRTISTREIALDDMQNTQDNVFFTPGPSTPVPSAPATPRQTKPLRSSLRSRPGASPASFADSGLGIRSTATKTYPSDAARLLAERVGEDGTETPTGKGKGKRKADDAEVTPPDMRRARFGSDIDEHGALSAAFSFSHAPSSFGAPSRRSKRARLNSPEPRPPSAQGQHSNFGRTQPRASPRPYSRGTASATPDAQARREKRTSLSGASIPISALVAPHAPSLSHLTDGSYRMRDPRKPASRKMHTAWSLRLRNADAGEEGSPVQAWFFYLGFVTLITWFVGAFWRVPRTRVLKEGGDDEKGRDVLVDDPQVEFDARRWRLRCRVMAIVGICTYIPFVVLVGVFVGR